MRYAFPAPSIPSIPVLGSSERFPVRRIYTIGRNYADHAAETGLGSASEPVPGISLKPSDSIWVEDRELPYPPMTEQLDPEIELVVAIGRDGTNVMKADALEHVFGYAVGYDMIRRDIMRECIANEHSWDLCKSFSGASPVSELRPASDFGHPNSGNITLEINGELRQQGNLSQMIWDTADIIARLSSYCSLRSGDIIFTGTPKGPKPVERGDKLSGVIEGVGHLELEIV
ncbi:MAG: fumarylacetoacetate hydrolase family protein [Pseudomonadota bacterium]|nr:fumarylacetoacetate hydrolase family protein [Pseudomonadota bacterium]